MVMRQARGFTLIELLAVLAIVGLLLALASPRYFRSVDNARETVLAENLRITRTAIDQFHADSGRYPEALEELVARRYLRGMPVDPVIGASTAWIIIAPPPGVPGRVADLKSSARGTGRNGLPYAQW
jgi:general secretion pathway protein G